MAKGLDIFIQRLASVLSPNTWGNVARGAWKIAIKWPIAYIRSNLWIQVVLGTTLLITVVLILFFTWKNRKGYREVHY